MLSAFMPTSVAKPGKVHRYIVAEEELIARRSDSGELQVFEAADR
jgi:hypothetical protein